MTRTPLKYLTILIFTAGMLRNSACLAEELLLEEIVFDKNQIETSFHAQEFQQDQIKEISCVELPYLENKHFFGYLEARRELVKRGIAPEVNYTTDSFFKLRGKNISQNIKSIGLVDYSLTIDTEKLGLIQGGTLYALGQNLHAFNLATDFVGDIQGISNIDAPVSNRLGELWYKQSLFKDKAGIKLGKQDTNCDFDALESSGNFINSSFTLMPNIPMPSYPDQALGAAVFIEPIEQFNLKAGVYDGSSEPSTLGFRTAFDGQEGTFTIVESGIKPIIKKLPGNYITGFWFDSGYVDEISEAPDARTFSSNYGFYAGIEQAVYKENEDDNQGLYIQGQYGWNPSNRNEIARFYSIGFTYFGLINKRDQDVLGFGTAIANLSGRTQKKDEIVLESFYQIQLTPWFAIQPDMQYIFNPGGNNKNAFILGVRTLVSF